nr:hypothetical protein [Escherichia coli]
MIQIRFGDNFIYLETNKLIPSKELLENVKRSHKYHQIVTSIESLGIIEPIIVFYDKDKDVTKILDGHLRVEALKDLGIGLSESFAITLGSMPFITFALSFMASTSEETKKLQTEYGSDMLKFVIIQSYINKLLGNSKVLHWFLENEVDYLNELKRISRINSLDDKTLTENSKS